MSREGVGDESSRIIQVTFRGVEVGSTPTNASDMRLVLKTTDTAAAHEYLVPVPSSRDGEYSLLIRQYISHAAVPDSLLGEVQDAVGSHMSSVTIRHREEADEDVAVITLVTDEMDVSTFDVPLHTGVLYAMLHGLPIQVEERLLQPSIRKGEELQEGMIRRRSPEAEYAALRHGISEGHLPGDYDPDRLADSLAVIGADRARDLKEMAVETERYEWAQAISDHFSEAEEAPSEGEDRGATTMKSKERDE